MVEILVALGILTFGLLSLLALLNRAYRATEPIEFDTRASLLADSILAGIRADPAGFPFIPGVNNATWPALLSGQSIYNSLNGLSKNNDGTPYQLPGYPNTAFVFSIPGNGVDDDAGYSSALEWTDQNGDGMDDVLFGSLPILVSPSGFLAAGVRDFDGKIENDINQLFLRNTPLELTRTTDPDGDQINGDTGDSSNALIPYQELVSFLMLPDGDFFYDPQRGVDEELSNGVDDDGDGMIDEDLKLSSQRISLTNNGVQDQYPLFFQIFGEPANLNERNPYFFTPWLAGDLVDNDGDGRVDEEIFNGLDEDNDGLVDEDCRGALLPFNPIPFSTPNDDLLWQIMVRRVPIKGDGVDNDRDGRIDEEFFNLQDDDLDGLIDGDVWDFAAPDVIMVVVTIFKVDDNRDNDGDGWIDEETEDGLDNDLDGRTDEDLHTRKYQTSGLVFIK